MLKYTFSDIYTKHLRKFALISGLGILGLLIPQATMADQGVDDLRGRWDIGVAISGMEDTSFRIFVNDLEASPTGYMASGCMKSKGGFAPLLLQAQAVADANNDRESYLISARSTVIPSEGDPFAIQFLGHVQIFGGGVADDIAGGEDSTVRTEFSEGSWDGVHHDRRRKKCPAVEIPPLKMRGDVGAHPIFNGYYRGETEPTVVRTGYEVQTDIPAAAARVQRPDGTTAIIRPVTDFFAGFDEFRARFVFQTPWEEMDPGYPVPGGLYRFTLLDPFGREIAGATAEDGWTACTVPPPGGLSLSLDPQGIRLAWDAVAPAGLDEFGMYSISLATPMGGFLYSAGFMSQASAPEHIIPFSFVPGAAGNPDGYDFGLSLNELPSDSAYVVRVDAFAEADGNTGWECHAVDFDEQVMFTKDSAGFIIFP